MPPPLCDEDRRELLRLARAAITEAILRNRILDLPQLSGRLAEPAGAFVTLFRHGRLRGCVGLPGRGLALGETVVQAAIGAAGRDSRFAAVPAEELPELEIEISVLSQPKRISANDVQIGVHGLIVQNGETRGLLLPQVAAERSWTVQRFLEETCRKAGLRPDAWQQRDTEILGFEADVFSERGLSPPAEFRKRDTDQIAAVDTRNGQTEPRN